MVQPLDAVWNMSAYRIKRIKLCVNADEEGFNVKVGRHTRTSVVAVVVFQLYRMHCGDIRRKVETKRDASSNLHAGMGR